MRASRLRRAGIVPASRGSRIVLAGWALTFAVGCGVARNASLKGEFGYDPKYAPRFGVDPNQISPTFVVLNLDGESHGSLYKITLTILKEDGARITVGVNSSMARLIATVPGYPMKRTGSATLTFRKLSADRLALERKDGSLGLYLHRL